ncbi:serine/threonine protein kinase [Georgenia satyanarayanai]|uniref:non-specific serine/threonine protein kinase n=1 Tax=Georgenia satyanarayanai TaxID=860221 RepID=A0A2Y9ASR8_9MICO|nr:Stk1 family PASTA domain-containing Ser/Thr kinase [Georgenia satyanarayanai]PYF97767.1 serine/threonine-protein kinase [Georgenia satyanarayanai]SSA45507.1 serine/threonine protein kinase [Georgenia satyanarayanai]
MDEVPKVLAGRYEVRELIGRGGMAEVYIGYDNRLSRTVAIKVLRSDLARDPTFQARFRREAQSAASLNHPAIVSVYDTGEDDVVTSAGERAHVPYIVMEYVEGHTVRSLLTDGSAVPIDEASEIVIGVLSALAYSHREGIVHRDIKPGNVMLTPTGQVKVMDFGIARAMADSAATMTQTHAVVGTAQYLSPEQARGEVVDARSDIYSTGCLLYELLTGQPPFSGDSAVAVAYQHVREIPKPPSEVASDIPEALDRIVLKSLAKDREDRYPDATAMRSDLEAALRGGAVSAPATSTWAAAAAAASQPTTVMGASPAATQAMPAARTRTAVAAEEDAEEDRRSPWWVWLLVLVGLLAAAGVAYLLLTRDDADEPVAPATVTVPELEGMDQTEAREAVEEEGLTFAIGDPEFSAEIEPGLFVSSDPEVGATVEEGETVTVSFSSGPEAVEMPDVIGLSQRQAQDQLSEQELGIPVRITYRPINDPDYEQDRVAQTEPEAGVAIEPDSEVVLHIATGNVEVPDFASDPSGDPTTFEEARDALAELGISVTRTARETGDFEPGTVLEQSRSGTVPRLTSIELVVAEPAPEPPPEPTTPSDDEPPSDEEPPPEDEPTDEETSAVGPGNSDFGRDQGRGNGP